MNKNSLLYIGVFLAGAVITPLYLSLFTDNDGDRPSEVAEENTTFSEPDDAIISEETSNKIFVPRDSQEAIESDYAVSPELKIPTSLPQYAADQPSIPNYPNYAAMSPVSLSFPESSSSSEESPPDRSMSSTENLTTNNQAIAPQSNRSVPIIGSTSRSLADDIFTPPSTRPDSEAIAPEPFRTGNIAPVDIKFDFGNFATDSPASEEDN